MQDGFRKVAAAITTAVGSPKALLLAVGIVAAWAVTGPLFGFSDTWQLAINTGTTIVTFLMVFVIQASQNRDAKAIHLKLDELIHATPRARNALIDEEHESEARMREDEARAQRQADRAHRSADRAQRAGAAKSPGTVRKAGRGSAEEPGSTR